MPIYEFYCHDCHTIFNFLSQRVDTEKRPKCPRCDRPQLQRQVSLFSISKGVTDSGDDPLADIDETKMEKAMEALAGDAEGINEDDPRQVAGLMRKLYDATGLHVGPGMEEAINRMESGEDPDKIEEDLGDLLESEDPFALKSSKGFQGFRKKFLPPSVDETLYQL